MKILNLEQEIFGGMTIVTTKQYKNSSKYGILFVTVYKGILSTYKNKNFQISNKA